MGHGYQWALGLGLRGLEGGRCCLSVSWVVLWVGWGQRAPGHSVSPEQMGRILQRTAISTNIKERLDFSCALFGPDGGLVSNAPHIPVHLGAMQETVQFQVRWVPLPAFLTLPPSRTLPTLPVFWLQIQHLGADLHPGDVLLSNHPSAGGSHLPDLTVITPVRMLPGNPRGGPTS